MDIHQPTDEYPSEIHRKAVEGLMNDFLDAARSTLVETGRNSMQVSDVIKRSQQAANMMSDTHGLMNRLVRKGLINVTGGLMSSPPFWSIELTPAALPPNFQTADGKQRSTGV
jgi:hypothetical protein